MKKSIKKYIKVGCLIRTDCNEIYEVTLLKEKTFECKNILFAGSELENTQEFYYNIDMVVYKYEASNISQKDL